MSGIGCLLLPLVTCLGQVDPPKAKVTPAAIERAIENLAADRFADREAASRFLWQAGRAAEPALRKAATSADAEVAARALEIVRKFDLGIYPDTPPEVADRIQRYSLAGNTNLKLAVLKELLDLGHGGVAVKLLNHEPNEADGVALVSQFGSDITIRTTNLLGQEKLDEAKELFRLGALAGHEGMIVQYVMLLHLSGRLPEQMKRWQEAAEKAEGATSAKLLFRGLRLQGKLADAAAVAKRHDLRDLQLSAAFHQGDWKTAAALQDAARPEGGKTQRAYVEWLGFAATFDRLAGRHELYEKRIAEVIETGKSATSVDFYCVEALLINERFEEAIEVAQAGELAFAVQLLYDRRQFREALGMAGWKDLQPPSVEEMKAFAKTALSGKRRDMAFELCKQLMLLGRRKEAEAFFDRLIAHRAQSSPSSFASLCGEAVKAGLIDRVDAYAAKALGPWPRSTLSVSARGTMWEAMYPKRRAAAEAWWRYFTATSPNEPASPRIEKVRQMMVPQRGAQLGVKRLEETFTAAMNYSPPGTLPKTAPPNSSPSTPPVQPSTAKANWLFVVGETCVRHGRKDLARVAYEQAAPHHAKASIKLGDLQREAGEIQDAIGSYRRAVEKEPTNALARYLYGVALELAGDAEAGRRQRLIAGAFPRDSKSRAELSDGLKERKLMKHARRQWELGLRIGGFGDWYVGNSAMNLTTALRETEPGRAAGLHHKYWLRKLWTGVGYVNIVAHLRASVSYHKYRAMALLKAGKKQQAVRELERSLPAIPGYMTFVREVVPILDKHDLRDVGDRFFERMFEINEEVCHEFPDSAVYHNNLAWTAAFCERRLDRAMELVGRAIELEPDNVNYLQTLAEVHFRRGDRAKAIKIAQQCVERAPYAVKLKEHLKRYRERK